jgi:ubiquinone/menaquinone biosynthesis C-methylase UbiE
MNTTSTYRASDGEGYELVMGRWSRRLAGPFLDFAGALDGERVLDVGCGTGHLARAIVERSEPSEVRAVDLAPAYIEQAQKHPVHPRVHFEVGDACALQFADRGFDRAFSLLVLHFVPRPERAIAEMRRVVRPGGVVAAAVSKKRRLSTRRRTNSAPGTTLGP